MAEPSWVQKLRERHPEANIGYHDPDGAANWKVIRESDGVVVNVVRWDGDTKKWSPPPGHRAERQ